MRRSSISRSARKRAMHLPRSSELSNAYSGLSSRALTTRLVAYLWIGDLNVNEELMKRGMGWYDSENGIEPFLYQLETEARAANRGLWASPAEKRVAPWVLRKEER